MIDGDDVLRAPDKRVALGADAVGIEDDEAPGHCDQDCELPLDRGQRQAVDAGGDMTRIAAREVDAASSVDVDIVSTLPNRIGERLASLFPSAWQSPACRQGMVG